MNNTSQYSPAGSLNELRFTDATAKPTVSHGVYKRAGNRRQSIRLSNSYFDDILVTTDKENESVNERRYLTSDEMERLVNSTALRCPLERSNVVCDKTDELYHYLAKIPRETFQDWFDREAHLYGGVAKKNTDRCRMPKSVYVIEARTDSEISANKQDDDVSEKLAFNENVSVNMNHETVVVSDINTKRHSQCCVIL